jgi:hypothetical protein
MVPSLTAVNVGPLRVVARDPPEIVAGGRLDAAT